MRGDVFPIPHVTAAPPDLAFDQWLNNRLGAESASTVMKIRPILLEAWTEAVRWYSQRGGGIVPDVVIGDDVQATTNTVPVSRALLKKVVETLEQVFDLPEDQQSPELIALIAELKELSE